MANTKTMHITEWNNYHFNGPFPTKVLFDIDTDRNISQLLRRYNDSAAEIQRLIQDSMDNSERLRAYGSSWSLSNVAHQQDRMLFNARLNIKKEITAGQLHANTAFSEENLFLFQCGTTVKEISEFLLKSFHLYSTILL